MEKNDIEPNSGSVDDRSDLGRVSEITGIPEDVIEKWESQFEAVKPELDAKGSKIYSHEDVERLKALGSLADAGHDVSEFARFPLQELRACLGSDDVGAISGGGVGSKSRLILVGTQIPTLLEESGGLGDATEVVGRHSSFDAWTSQTGSKEADLLVLDCPAIFPETVDLIRNRIEESKALRAVVVYQFLKEGTLKSMEDPAGKITALRAPVTARDLKEACEADLALAAIRNSSLGIGDMAAFDPAGAKAAIIPEPEPGEEDIPARQYSDPQLSKFSQISTAINCECPHHLAALLSALNAFELYSRDCENRDAEDAALHAFLHRRTARARAIMEDALAVLAEAEGITVS